MDKFYNNVGYAVSEETRPGIYEERFIERPYYGEVVRNSRRLQSSENLNDTIRLNTEISIVADPYAFKHYFDIRYAIKDDHKWKVENVEVRSPRLVLTLGGLFNE